MKRFKLSYIIIKIFFIKKRMEKTFFVWTTKKKINCGTSSKHRKYKIELKPFYIFSITITKKQI